MIEETERHLGRIKQYQAACIRRDEIIAEQIEQIERLRKEGTELAHYNYEMLRALLELYADKSCAGNCKIGDGKVSAMCWRHKLIQDVLGDDLSYADLIADGGLPEARAALKEPSK